MRLTPEQVSKMSESDAKKHLLNYVAAQDEFEKLVAEFEMRVNTYAEIVGYDWVVKCPYRSCGSAEVKPIRKLSGAIIYSCNSCNHIFKVLQEGDVYFYDVGKEEWVSGEFSMRPSYFTLITKPASLKSIVMNVDNESGSK